MKLMRIIKEITPPILLQKLTRFSAQNLPEFSSWKEALERSTEDAYEHSKLTKLVCDKTKIYCKTLSDCRVSITNSEIQTIAALGITISSQKDAKEKISVIDFGGACGAHFYLAKAVFKDIDFDWRVIETEGMVRQAGVLESEQLHFYISIKDAVEGMGKIHLVHSSGTLQCIPDPYLVLEELININSKFILLSRLGITPESSEIITIHRHMMSANGPGSAPVDFKDEPCAYPFQYPVKRKIETVLSKNYKIEFVNDDPTDRFAVGSHKIIGISYFCRQKEKA